MKKLIPEEHVLKVCQPCTANACSYLLCGPDGWECAKGTEFESVFDARRRNEGMDAICNNCPGLILCLVVPIE